MTVATERFVVLMTARHPLATQAEIGLKEPRAGPFGMGRPECWRTLRSRIEGTGLQAEFRPGANGAVRSRSRLGRGRTGPAATRFVEFALRQGAAAPDRGA